MKRPASYSPFSRLFNIVVWSVLFFAAGVSLAHAADTDRDRLDDSQEIALGTDPANPDTDGDGFLDGEEVEYLSNPLDPNDTPDLLGATNYYYSRSFSILNTFPPSASETQGLFYSRAFMILNTSPPSTAGMPQGILSPSWSVYNGALLYDPALPPYVTSVRLSDRDGQPYVGYGEYTDETTVRVDVTTAWPVDTFIVSTDDFATSFAMAATASFDYTFTNDGDGWKALWIKAVKDGVTGPATMDGIWLRTPETHTIDFTHGIPGWILAPQEADEWSFFGRQGRMITVAVDPHAPSAPYLERAGVTLRGPDNSILGTAESTANGALAIIRAVQLPADGVYRIQVAAASATPQATGNYLVAIYEVTPNELALVLNTKHHGQVANPYTLDRWHFTAAAQTVVRLRAQGASGPVSYRLTGPMGWEGFSGLLADSSPINLPATGEYILEVTAQGQAGAAYAFTLEQTNVIDLTLGTPYSGQWAGSGQAQLFRVSISPSMPARIVLNDNSSANSNELYVRLGSPATRAEYDYRFSDPSAADQQVMIQMAAAGTWYILIYSANAPQPGGFTLLAAAADLLLTSVTPDRAGTGADVHLTLVGAGFVAGTQVELVGAGGTAYQAGAVEVDSFTQLTATFLAGSVPAGTYSIRAKPPLGNPAELPNAFQMIDGGRPELVTNLVVPAQLGYHGIGTIYIEFRNAGNAAMPAPLLVLTATQEHKPEKVEMGCLREGAFLTLQATRLVKGFWTSAEPEGFSHSVQLLACGDTPGVLQPGESGRVPVYYAGWQQPWDLAYPPMNWNLGVLTADTTATVEWGGLKDSMRPATMDAETWEPLWANFTAEAGQTWGAYVTMLDSNAAYLGRLGQRVVDVGDLLAFEFQQADGISPVRSLAGAADAVVEAPGLPIVFSRSYAQPISRRYATGRLGRGWSHNWQMSLSQEDGKVVITGPAGSRRIFQPDSRRAAYFPPPGDHATLTKQGNGAFILQELGGLRQAFRPDGKLDYIEDLNGNRITSVHTGELLTNLQHSSGQSVQIAYNEKGRIQTVTDSVGCQTLFTYDAAGEHLAAVQADDGRITNYSYITGQGASREHALSQIGFPGGINQYFDYDARGRLANSHRDNNIELVSFAYDSAGKVTATDATGGSSKFYFDHRGLLVKTENALQHAVTLNFNEEYNLIRTTDPTGRSYTYGYDAKGNLARSTDPHGNMTRFAYTSLANRLAAVTDARGNQTRYDYDAKANLQSITYADGSSERWGAYDASGDPQTWTNRRGRSINYTYDDAGRITSKLYPDGSRVEYAYDARGNMVQSRDANSSTTLGYDAHDRLLRVDTPGGRFLEFTYDDAGRRASSVDQLGHRLDYHYDAAGRLESLTDQSGREVVRYAYDPAGRLSRKTLGNGVYTTYDYDAAGQLLHLINAKPDDAVLSRFDYTYDSRGRRTAMAMLDGTWSYEYDDLGQLTHTVLEPTTATLSRQDLTYIYDALGNRIRTIENGVTTDYTTNNMNQYTQVGDTAYRFDADGNMIQEITPQGTTNFTYNDENKLVAVSKGTDTWAYTYDPTGNRVATTENGITTHYVIDPIGLGNVVGEYDDDGNLIANYDHGLSLLSRTDAAGNPAYYTFDAIGNVQQLVNAASGIIDTYAYTPFGTMLKKMETIPNPFQFVGQFGVMSEHNALMFMRARYYIPAYGRFTATDPIGIAGGDLNLYRYCNNDPIMGIDPSGNLPFVEIAYYVVTSYNILENIRNKDYNMAGFHIAALQLEVQGRVASRLGKEISRIGSGIRGIESMGRGLGTFGLKMTTAAVYLEGALLLYEINDNFYHWIAAERDWARAEQGRYDVYTKKSEVVARKLASQMQSLGSRPTSVTQSIDPNSKIGPIGIGLESYIGLGYPLIYRVDFENESTATAPCQQVIITDPLSSNLDLTTFEWTEIGWGDQFIVVPPDTQHFEASVPVSYLGTDFEVQIEAGMRSGTGQAYITFRAIDPDTGLPPSVDIGFLPPEDGTGRGQGHVSYIIKPKPDLATGTEIRNVALISFDRQTDIATNQVNPHDPAQGTDPTKECLNTIDAGAPESAVAALPPLIQENQFDVAWSGADDAGGSGIADYDIFVATDGGPYTTWLANTTQTLTLFTGAPGHTYAFYSIARDNVGHIESAPAAPDAMTTVQIPPRGNVTIQVTPSDAPWSLTDGDGGIHQGIGDATLTDVPAGQITLTWGTLHNYVTPTPNPVIRQLGDGETETFSGTYTLQQVRLSVASAHGQPVPAAGSHDYTTGTMVSAWLPNSSELDTTGTTRFLATGWTGSGAVPSSGATTQTTFILDQDSAIAWHWRTQYKLSATALPPEGGRVLLADGLTTATGTWHDAGTTATLRAIAQPGWVFGGWGGAASGNATSTTLAMDAPTSVTATFVITTHTLTYTAGAGGSISGTSPQTVDYGSDGTQVTAVPNTGYHFVKWSDDVMTASRTDTRVTANISVAANFAINPLPHTPANISPANGATVVSLTPRLVASDFSDPGVGDTHAASQWQVREFSSAPDYSTTVFDSGADAMNLTSIAISAAILNYNTTYSWRVRYQNNLGTWSGWSSETSFATFSPLLIPVPAGTFTMGRRDDGDDAIYGGSNELPRHSVTLSAYEIGKYEVTNVEFCEVLNWALAQNYLTNSGGGAYAGGTVYSNGRIVLEMSPAIEVEYSGRAFVCQTRDGYPMADFPVIVPWHGAVAFCNWLSEIRGLTPCYDLSAWQLIDADSVAPGMQFYNGYRLPTEAEWERAAGWDAGASKHWIYGYMDDTLAGSARCNWRLDGAFVNPFVLTNEPYTSPVGWFNGVSISPNGDVQTENSPSPVGCYDMTGNVMEWVNDWARREYGAGNATDPMGPDSGSAKLARGGSYDSPQDVCRSASRNDWDPTLSHSIIGFRIARSLAGMPRQPENIAPADGTTGVSLTPALSASAFSDPNAGNTHAASRWQVRESSSAPDYSATVFDSGTDATNLTSIEIPAATLKCNTSYFWRVCYQNNQGAWSAWSIETGFTAIQQQYTLTYTAGANGSITGTTPQTVNYGACGSPVTAVPNTGYHFVRWSDGSRQNPRTDMNVTTDISVTATFTINQYILVYMGWPNGYIKGKMLQIVSYGACGSPVTAVPNTGYHFVRWSDGSTQNPRTDTNVTANKFVMATFTINRYTLTYLAGPNGSIKGTTPQIVNYGAWGSPVTAVPNTGYHFVQWSDGLTKNPRTDMNVRANKCVTATFAIN